MLRLSLRARLVAAFVGVVAVGTFLAAALTMLAVHRTFDHYLDRRAKEATLGGVQAAQVIYARDRRGWTESGLDQLAHELVLTGYDFKLSDGGRTLVDTTRSTSDQRRLIRVGTSPIRDSSGRQVATLDVFALRGGGSTPADADFRGELDRIHFIAAAFASLLAIILGLLLARRLTGPLRTLAAAARSLPRPPASDPIRVEGAPEIQDLSRALTGLSDSLERQHRARRQLAQDLAHELRTPLTLVLSRIEGMQDGVVPFDRDGLESLRGEVLRLTRLIGDIERLAEFEAQPRRLETGPIDLHRLATEAEAAHRDVLERAGITLTVDARPTRALGDADAARQILTNLLSNALKYTQSGGQVLLETRPSGDEALLVVSDTGPGIGDDEIDKVFDRAYRGSATRTLGGGAGLGLAIAHELAAAQGGMLSASQSARGAVFTLALPASTPARATRWGPAAAAAARTDAGTAQPSQERP